MQIPLAERLEAGEILRFLPCPAALPDGEDRQLLLGQRLQPGQGKYIRFIPSSRQLQGRVADTSQQTNRLGELFRAFSQNVTRWLGGLLPHYASAWKPDQVTWRTEEEATRRLHLLNRNDLLHIDVFPNRPTNGARILRLFVNLHPTDPRVWATSDSFRVLLERFGAAVGMPNRNTAWPWKWGQGLLSLIKPGDERGEYDRFMLRLHQFLKSNEEYQERALLRLCHFQPGEAWLAFTDGVSHAELRGQFALEHSFFVPLNVLSRPELAPASLLQQACGQPKTPKAA